MVDSLYEWLICISYNTPLSALAGIRACTMPDHEGRVRVYRRGTIMGCYDGFIAW